MYSSDTKIMKNLLKFIICFYIIICIIGVILSYFHKNLLNINTEVSVNSEYANLNLYFLKMTKNNNVKIRNYGLVDDDTSSYFITFENADGTTNTFLKSGNIIYFNKIKLCENVESFKVIVDKSIKTSVSIEVMILGQVYNSQYVLE